MYRTCFSIIESLLPVQETWASAALTFIASLPLLAREA